MMPFVPWLGMGSAAYGAPAPQTQPFPGRQVDLGAPQAAPPPETMPPDWAPAMPALPQNFVGPPQPTTDELAAGQAQLEEQARAAEVEQTLQQTAAAAQPAPASRGGAPRGTKEEETLNIAAKLSQPATSIQELIGRLNRRELDSLKAQGLTVEKLKKSLGELEGKELPIDLTGAAQLVDAWTGSNFAGSYRPPETAGERRAAVEKLRGQITSAEQGMSENEISLLRSQLNNAFQLENLSETKAHRAQQYDLEREKLAIDRAKLAKDAAKSSLDPMAAFQMRTTLDKLDTTKEARGNIKLAQALNEYEEAINKYGVDPVGEGAAALNGAYSRLTFAYKDAGGLGALSGPDAGLINKGVGDGGDLGGWFRNSAKGGAAGIKTQIKMMRGANAAGFQNRHANMKQMIAGYEPLAGEYVNEMKMQMDAAAGESSTKHKSRAEKEARARALGVQP